jgi:hypothetical protein
MQALASPGYCTIREFSVVTANDIGLAMPNDQVSDRGTSQDRPAHVKKSFDEDTISGSFHYGFPTVGAATLFEISASSGAILDITLDFILGDLSLSQQDPPSVSQPIVGATAGRIYHRNFLSTGSVYPDPELYNVI